MFTHKNLMTVCCAAVLAFGLAACGGGGGGGDAPVTDMDGDDTMTSSLVGKVFPDSTTFMLPAGLVDDITVSVKEGDTVDVPGVGNFRCVTGPCTVDVASDVVTTTGRIEVVSLAEGLPAAVLTTLASIPEDAPAGPTPATPEQMTAAAATKVTAIDKEAAQTAGAGLGGIPDAAANPDPSYVMTIKRDSDGTTVEIKDPAYLKTAEPQFIQQDVDLGEGRTMLVRVNSDDADGKVEEVVIVKTDIKAAKATPLTLNFDLDPLVDTDGDEDLTNDFTALTVVAVTGGPTEDEVEFLKLIKSAAFTRPGTTPTLNFASAAAATAEASAVVAFETAGTYNGAMGTYRCNAAAGTGCSVGFGGDDKITAISDGWIFTPAPGETIDVADDDYLSYGFWLMRTTKDGATTYNEVETFAEATGIDQSEALTDVKGTAEYEGGAVGVYVKNVFDLEGEIDTATSGHFVADASLTATFGQVENDAELGTIAPSMLNTLTGTIDNFVLQHGEQNAWSVALKGDIAPAVATATGTANGGGPEGSFSAIFHGSVAPAEDAAVGDDVPQPSSVVGEFNANFGNGTVAGGFGVNKK